MRFYGILDGKPGAYGIFIPDCPGCTAMGTSEDEVLINAIEALAEWVGDQDKGYSPSPSAIETLKSLSEVQETLQEGASFIAVPLILEQERPVKANISLNKGLLDAIDDAANHLNLTRSAFLAAAAKEKLHKTY